MRVSARSLHIAGFITMLPMCFIVGYGCTNVKLLGAVPVPPQVTLEIQNYCPKAGFQVVDQFVYNSSAYFDGTQWTTDIDQDGLPDTFEKDPTNVANYGISALSADTNGNGYSDLVKVRLGLTASQQNFMPICNTPGIDTDGDGLSDCEEAITGTDSTQADNDLDGIPDGLEMRFGTNPMDAHDAALSNMGDNYSNLQKIKMGIMANVFLQPIYLSIMPSYTTTINTTTGCATIDVANIPIVQTANGNMIKVIALEDSQNPPTNGTHSVDREARVLSILLPSGVSSGSKVIVPDGIHGQSYGGASQPPVQYGGTSS